MEVFVFFLKKAIGPILRFRDSLRVLVSTGNKSQMKKKEQRGNVVKVEAAVTNPDKDGVSLGGVSLAFNYQTQLITCH